MKPFSLLTIALVMSIATVTHAQKGTLKGTVTDGDTKEGIPFLSVYVSDKSVGVTTDFDGNYQMELNGGTYEIIFSSIEYGKTSKNVTIAAGETVTQNVTLEKADIKMETILVKTDKYAKPIEDVISSMEIIKPELVENKGSTDVKAALEQTPGLTIVDSEPQLRGGSGYSFGAGSRVLIMVDDLPLLTGDAGRPSWGFIPVENIEQIEVIKGAASVLYGSAALNGVINIRTAYPTNEPQTKINLLTGIYDKPRREEAKWWDENSPFYTALSFLHSRRATENFSFVVGGNLFLEQGFVGPPPLDLTDSTTTALTLNKGEFTKRGRINFNTRKKSSTLKGLAYGLNGNIMVSHSAGSLIWLNDSTGLYRAFGGALTTTRQTTFNLDPYVEYLDASGNKFSLNTRVFFQNNNNDNDQANKNYVYYGEFRYLKMFQRVRDFTLSSGLMGNYVTSNSQLFGQRDSLGNIEAVDRSAYNLAVYAQLDKKFFDRLNVTIGGRWEFFDVDGLSDNQPVFRAGVSGRVHKATYLRTSFGQGFRIPTIAERYITTEVGGVPIIQNPDLVPEKSWNFEVGVKQGVKIGKGGNFLGYLDVAGFIQQYTDYVEFIADQWLPSNANDLFGYGFKSVNTGNARVSGIDFSLLGQGKFNENFGMNVLAGYTYTKPITLTPDFIYGQTAGIPPFLPPQDITYLSSSSLTNKEDASGNEYIDSSENILKYRYEHLVKADIEGTYKGLSLGVSFRLYSFMKNVDVFFQREATLRGIDASIFREQHEHPEYIFDFRIAYEIASHSKIAFIINNALNREYALRPLDIDAPRSYVLQYTLDLKGKSRAEKAAAN